MRGEGTAIIDKSRQGDREQGRGDSDQWKANSRQWDREQGIGLRGQRTREQGTGARVEGTADRGEKKRAKANMLSHKSLYVRHTGESRCPGSKNFFSFMDTGRHTSGDRLAECVAGGFSRFLKHHCNGISLMR